MIRFFRTLVKLPFLFYLRIHERQTTDGLKYLHFKRGSKILAIVFSAFDANDSNRAYNYVRSFSKLGIDFLFLSDPWGYRGSYYLLERGSDAPELATQVLINHIVNGGGYNVVLTMGTSKGGSAALYYGLKNNVNDIVIGACQYRIGSYISEYPDIFKGMTDHEVNDNDISRLNNLLPNLLNKSTQVKSKIHLLHSKQEPTYQRDIKYLIADLNRLGFNWEEIECGFKEHNEVGKYFSSFAKKFITQLIR